MRRLQVHLYAICWNEARMLGFFFRHYLPWVDRFVIYDDGSTDDSIAILSAIPSVDVRQFPRTHSDSYVLSAQALQNNCWKESRGQADWVVVTAIDEHLHHADILNYLYSCRKHGITLLPALGYQMISDEFPAKHEYLAASRTQGTPWGVMNKLSIFDPDLIEETNFEVGRHEANPTGEIVLPEEDELLLLHYKYLGQSYLIERNSFLAGGLGKIDRANQWGYQYTYSKEKFGEQWDFFKSGLVDIALLGADAWKQHREPRSWQSWTRYRPWWKSWRK